MKNISALNNIYVSKSKILNSGRGVFAGRDIKKGEIIERCPAIEVSENDTAKIKDGILITYLFYFGKNKDRSAIALGYGSIYNHSNKPNSKFEIHPKDNVIDFIAVINIEKDDEITFNYRGLGKSKLPLWFEKE